MAIKGQHMLMEMSCIFSVTMSATSLWYQTTILHHVTREGELGKGYLGSGISVLFLSYEPEITSK